MHTPFRKLSLLLALALSTLPSLGASHIPIQGNQASIWMQVPSDRQYFLCTIKRELLHPVLTFGRPSAYRTFAKVYLPADESITVAALYERLGLAPAPQQREETTTASSTATQD